MDHRVVTDYSNVELENTHLKVYVRLRPPADGADKVDPHFLDRPQGDPKRILLRDPTHHHYGEYVFMYDRVFWTDSKQDDIFNTVCKAQVEHVLSGFNSCCFAYGQTGSGKTHTMFGAGGDQRGLIPRAIEYLGDCLETRKLTKEVAIVVSFLEIYCDQIRDLGKAYLRATDQGEGEDSDAFNRKTSEIFSRMQMARNESFARVRSGDATLSPSGQQTMTTKMEQTYNNDYSMMNLEIREDAEGNVFVKDLSLIPVTNVQEVMAVVNMGLKLRATHETKMNQVSSRSHTVFTVTVMQKDRVNGDAVSGTLHLVDLAGSERLKKSDSQGLRLREALHINSSLTALGKVVVALDPSSERSHVPYRDSKLTRILQNSLGGNSYTTVVATIHPMVDYSEECLSSLQFANRCRNVQNQPRVNYIGSTEADKDKRIKRLTEEVANLQKKLRNTRDEQTQHTMTMLRSLGMKAMVLPDGSVELSDGRKIGSSGVLTDSLTRMDGRRGSEFMDFESARMADMAQAMVAKLQNTVESLQLEIQELKKQNGDKKKEIKSLKDHAQRLQDYHDDMQRKWHTNQKTLQTAFDKRCRKFRDYATVTAAAHEQHTKLIINDSNTLLEEQHRLIQSIPQSLRIQSNALAQAREAEKRSRDEERERSCQQMKGMELGKNAELENLRQQYEYWLKKKHDEIITFTTDFNKYRQRYRAERGALSEELLTLFDYAVSLKRILDRAESGVYQLQQIGNLISMQIPRADRPSKDLLNDPSLLKVTRRLLEKRKKQTLQLQKTEHETTMALGECLGLNEAAARSQLESVMALHQDSDTKPKKTLMIRPQSAKRITTRASASTPSLRKRPQSAHPVLHEVDAHNQGKITRMLRPQSAPQQQIPAVFSPTAASALGAEWGSDGDSSEGPLLSWEEIPTPTPKPRHHEPAPVTPPLVAAPAPIPAANAPPTKALSRDKSVVFSNYSDEEEYGLDNVPPPKPTDDYDPGDDVGDMGEMGQEVAVSPTAGELFSSLLQDMPATGKEDVLAQSFGQPTHKGVHGGTIQQSLHMGGSNSRTIFQDYDDEPAIHSTIPQHPHFIPHQAHHHKLEEHQHLVDQGSSQGGGNLDPSIKLSLYVDPDHMDGVALRQLMRCYQGYIKGALERQDDQLVERGDDYVRLLKHDVDKYTQLYKDEVAKARELRAAYESLKRLMSKMREGGMIMHRHDSRLSAAEKHPELPASTRLTKTPVSASVRAL